MRLKKSVVALLGGLMLMLGVVATAEPASAAYGDAGYVLQNTEVRYGPSQFYGVAYVTSVGANIPLGCWTDDGYGHRWFSFAYQPAGRWVRADSVINQPSLPHC